MEFIQKADYAWKKSACEKKKSAKGKNYWAPSRHLGGPIKDHPCGSIVAADTEVDTVKKCVLINPRLFSMFLTIHTSSCMNL